jgi:hypothetical protein
MTQEWGLVHWTVLQFLRRLRPFTLTCSDSLSSGRRDLIADASWDNPFLVVGRLELPYGRTLPITQVADRHLPIVMCLHDFAKLL